MAEIDAGVWSVWRERVADAGVKWALRLLFVPDGNEVQNAEAALRSAVREVGAEHDESHAPAGSDPPFFGEWSFTRASAGVVIDVMECDVFEAALPAITAEIGRRGFSGTVCVWEPPAVYAPPKATMLACRITVRGERVSYEPGAFYWQPDRDAHARVVAAVESWCRKGPGEQAAAVGVGPGGPIPLDPGESAADRVREAFMRGEGAKVTAISDVQFRAIGIRAASGRIALVVGQQDAPTGWWKLPLREIVDLLAEHAERIAYAFVRPGWIVRQALYRDGLADDWPARRHHEPWGGGETPVAFDDLVAPDAFGVQLLGPGYTERIPVSDRWRTQLLDGGSTMVESADLDAWFNAPFVSGSPAGAATADPGVLERARREFESILCSPATLRAIGHPDALEPGT